MAGVSLDCILIGFAVGVLAVLNVLVARTMDGHLQAGFRVIAEQLSAIRQELRSGQSEIRQELRSGQTDMRAELREALSAMTTTVAATNQLLDRLARGQQSGLAE